MIVVAPVFLGLLPALVGVVGRRIDRGVGLPPLRIGIARSGFYVADWAMPCPR